MRSGAEGAAKRDKEQSRQGDKETRRPERMPLWVPSSAWEPVLPKLRFARASRVRGRGPRPVSVTRSGASKTRRAQAEPGHQGGRGRPVSLSPCLSSPCLAYKRRPPAGGSGWSRKGGSEGEPGRQGGGNPFGQGSPGGTGESAGQRGKLRPTPGPRRGQGHSVVRGGSGHPSRPVSSARRPSGIIPPHSAPLPETRNRCPRPAASAESGKGLGEKTVGRIVPGGATACKNRQRRCNNCVPPIEPFLPAPASGVKDWASRGRQPPESCSSSRP